MLKITNAVLANAASVLGLEVPKGAKKETLIALLESVSNRLQFKATSAVFARFANAKLASAIMPMPPVFVPNAEHTAKLLANWQVPSIAAARSTQHAVTVGGFTYPSFKQAFQALNLIVPNFKAKRLILKAEGQLQIGDHLFTLA